MSKDSSNHKQSDPKSADKVAISLQTIATGLLLYLAPPTIASFILFFGVTLFTNFSANHADKWMQHNTFAQFLFVLLTEALVIALLIRFMKWTKETWKSIGVVKPKLSNFVYTLLGFGVYYVVYIAAISIISLIVHLDFNQKQEIGFNTYLSGGNLVLAFASLVVLPPLVEEILFRGYLYTRLKKAFTPIVAALILSALFASAHLQFGSGNKLLWVAALDTFTLSMVMVYVREKTGNIWAGVGIHALKNFVAFLSLFIFHVQ